MLRRTSDFDYLKQVKMMLAETVTFIKFSLYESEGKGLKRLNGSNRSNKRDLLSHILKNTQCSCGVLRNTAEIRKEST